MLGQENHLKGHQDRRPRHPQTTKQERRVVGLVVCAFHSLKVFFPAIKYNPNPDFQKVLVKNALFHSSKMPGIYLVLTMCLLTCCFSFLLCD